MFNACGVHGLYIKNDVYQWDNQKMLVKVLNSLDTAKYIKSAIYRHGDAGNKF